MKRGPGTTPCRQRNKLNLKNKRHKNAVYEELDTSKGKPVSPSYISDVSSRDVSRISSLLSPFCDESSQDVVWDDRSELLSDCPVVQIEDILQILPKVDSPAVKRQIMSLGSMDKVTTNSEQQKNSLSKKRRQIDGDTLNTYLAAMLQRIRKTSSSQDQLENPSERLVSHLSSPIGASPNGIQENKENLVHTFQSPFSMETSTNCSTLNDSFFERENILDQLFADSFDENLLPASSCVSPMKDLTNFNKLSHQRSSCELQASSCINTKFLSHQAARSTTTQSPTQRTSISSRTHSSSTVSCPTTHSSPHTHSATHILKPCDSSPHAHSAALHILKPCDQKELTKQKTISGSWEENDEDDEDTMFWTQVANFMDESSALETDPFLTSLDHTIVDQIFQFDDDNDTANIRNENTNSSPKRACSQEDIEKKRQLAKRKLRQKLRTF